MKKECIAMLLAGGQGSRLYVLTGDMAKPAVPFGGKFRIIDFPLSNCTNSGIDTVGVLTQYRPLELNSYIGSGQPWELDRLNGGVHILPPYQIIEKISLPIVSVPKKNSLFGEMLQFSRSMYVGSFVIKKRQKTQANTMTARILPAMITALFFFAFFIFSTSSG